jgi:ppGpp synthetase/RelA/SpoT-type nucleotidyltranferase
VRFTKVDEYLLRYKDDYLDLLRRVTESVSELRKTHVASITNAYERPDSGFGPFKESVKIAAKLRKKGGVGAGARDLTELGDVVGYTVVVQYPDEREPLYTALRAELARHDVTVGELEKHENKGGYFAHHAICERRYGSDVLKCEVQIKTMLHDAWSKKMHDLTYKPAGRLDRRLAALMEAGSVTLESVEQQSQLIRDMIKANWEAEGEARREAREQLFGQMLANRVRVATGRPEAEAIVALHEELEAAGSAKESVSDEKYQELTEKVGRLCGRGSEAYSWILHAHLASLRPDARQVRKCIVEVDALFEAAPRLFVDGAIDLRDVIGAPLVFYVMGELALSIEYFDKLLENPKLSLPPETVAKIKFNRLNALVELEYHFPTDDAAQRIELQAEVARCLDDPGLAKNTDIEACIADLRGLSRITFATTTDEVRGGIKQCEGATELAVDDEREVSAAYADLNTRRGWRRFFEMEVASRLGL